MKFLKNNYSEINNIVYPYVSITVYTDYLKKLGAEIQQTVDYRKIVQPLIIKNNVYSNELQNDLTNMVLSSLCYLSGTNFVVVPYEPEFTINDATTGGKGTRVLPDLLVIGSITEFDKSIINTDSAFNFRSKLTNKKDSQLKKTARIVLDLFLLDYSTHAVIPGVHTTSAINISDLIASSDVGFEIFSDNIELRGRVKRKYGYHKAVRNLVDYSTLQLFSKYYDLPYWKLLNIDEKDKDIMDSRRKIFSTYDNKDKIKNIQNLLNRCKIEYLSNIEVTGKFDVNTKEKLSAYKSTYNLDFKQDDLEYIYMSLWENCSFHNN